MASTLVTPRIFAIRSGRRGLCGVLALFACGSAGHGGAATSSEPSKVERLVEEGRYVDAERLARRTLDGEANAGDRSSALHLWLEARILNGHGAEPSTRQAAEAAVAAAERAKSSGPERAAALANLAEVELATGNAARSALLFREALRHSPGDARGVATRAALGRALTEAGQFDAAQSHLQVALAASSRLRGRRALTATILERLGRLSITTGAFAMSRWYLDAAEKQIGRAGAHPVLAAVVNTHGELAFVQAQYERSEELERRALEIATRSLPENHPAIASYLIGLASAVGGQRNHIEARTLLSRALAIVEQRYGPAHPALADVLNDLALGDMAEGEYSAARRLFERALRIFEGSGDPDSRAMIPIVYNMGVVNQELGDYSDARRHYERATQMWRIAFGPEHRHVALGLSAIGESLAADGRLDDAQAAYTDALRIRRAALGQSHPDVAESLVAAARVTDAAGAARQALSMVEESLRAWESHGIADAYYARALSFAGEIRIKLGDVDQGRRDHERALGILVQSLGPRHPDVTDVELKLSLVDLAAGRDRAPALHRLLDVARRSSQRLRLSVEALSERQALVLSAQRPRPLDVAVTMLAESAPEAEREVSAIFDEIVRARGVVLDEVASRARTRSRSDDPAIHTAREALARQRQRLANLLTAPEIDSTLDTLDRRIQDARLAKEAAERQLADVSHSGNVVGMQDAGQAEVRRALPSDTALVSYVRYRHYDLQSPHPAWRDAYAAFVVGAGARTVTAVQLGDAATIDSAVTTWRQAVSAGSRRPLPGDDRHAGAELKALVWDRIGPLIAESAAVFVVPDGAIHFVNISALADREGRFVIEQSPTIHYLSVERDLLVAKNPTASRGLYATGRPTFTRPITPPNGPATAPSQDAVPCPAISSVRFDDLPGSGREVREIETLWRSRPGLGDALVHVGDQATEAAFKSHVAGHRVVHLATHGFVLGAGCLPTPRGSRGLGGLVKIGHRPERVDNPFLLAGFALAGALARPAPLDDDGLLTAEEILALDLQGTEWAVLSACDTGLGEWQSSEGVVGLRRAFQVAGARTVIMSLWSVDDDATQAWMAALYRARFQRGRSTAEAVRQASLEVLRQRRARGLSTHPFFWAPFVAAGDWR